MIVQSVALNDNVMAEEYMKEADHYRVIEPSFDVMISLDELSPEKRIEICGRICYKSENAITDESAKKFARTMVTDKHNSVLEMAVITYNVGAISNVRALGHASKYLVVDEYEYGHLITGSIRAFREAFMLCPHDPLIRGLAQATASMHPIFFEDMSFNGADHWSHLIEKVSLIELDHEVKGIFPHLWRRHRYLAVRFIVNRAVTHEIVRHRPVSFLQESQRYCRYSEERFGNQVTFIKPLFFAEDTPEYHVWLRSIDRASRDYFTLLKTVSPQAARTVLPNSCKTEIIVFANMVQWHHILHMRTSPAAEPSMREVMIPLRMRLMQIFPEEAFDMRFPEGYVSHM